MKLKDKIWAWSGAAIIAVLTYYLFGGKFVFEGWTVNDMIYTGLFSLFSVVYVVLYWRLREKLYIKEQENKGLKLELLENIRMLEPGDQHFLRLSVSLAADQEGLIEEKNPDSAVKLH